MGKYFYNYTLDCHKDRVTIFGLENNNQESVGCGNGFGEKVLRFKGKVYVEFVSDESVNKRGFALTYRTLGPTCKFLIYMMK